MSTVIILCSIVGALGIFLVVEVLRKKSSSSLVNDLNKLINSRSSFISQSIDLKRTNAITFKQAVELIKQHFPSTVFHSFSSGDVNEFGESNYWFATAAIDNQQVAINIDPQFNNQSELEGMTLSLSSIDTEINQNSQNIPKQLINNLKNDPDALKYLKTQWSKSTQASFNPEKTIDTRQLLKTVIEQGNDVENLLNPISVHLKFENGKWIWVVFTDQPSPIEISALKE